MLGSEIEEFFRAHPLLRRHFLGVFASDQLRTVVQRRLRNRTLCIVNTDVSTGEPTEPCIRPIKFLHFSPQARDDIGGVFARSRIG